MAVPFDHIASSYDAAFSRSAIGQLQRKRVWSYLEKITPQLGGLEILELNCGTGEDALVFSEKGFNIVATDVSEEMLKVTQQKAHQYSMQSRISSHYLDLDAIGDTVFEKKFDLVFSNFGGLNCINPESMQKLLQKIPSMLVPGGRFVAVIMPKLCLWETIYFLAKLQFRKAFRRWTSREVLADLHGVAVRTWYYTPRQIRRWAGDDFRHVCTRPIGAAVPPSYLENFFSRRKRWLLKLDGIEKRFSHMSSLSGLSDHFLIDIKLRNEAPASSRKHTERS